MNDYAEMIFTGDELLRGDILNSNQAYLGESLLELGIHPTHALSVVDSIAAIGAAIRQSLDRRPALLVLSGGLGPTDDDLTREALADALSLPLEHHESLLQEIRRRFASLGFKMTENNRKQALIPRGSTAIPLAGTAPGFYLIHGDVLIVALPGVPWELKEMWEGTVAPLLRSRSGERVGHLVRRIRTFGIGESKVAELLSGFDWRGSEVDIGTRASLESLNINLRGPASPEGRERLDDLVRRICAILGERVYGVDSQGLVETTGLLLHRLGLTVSVAESCTAGLVGKRLTEVPGSSEYFVGGVIAYSNEVKNGLLKVPADVLREKGAVSEEVALAMAQGVADLLGTDCSLSTTGIAGPGGGTEDKPVGLVLIGSVVRGVAETERLRLFGNREQVRERAALAAIDLLRRRLQRLDQ